MKEITINCARISSMAEMHDIFSRELNFPGWYGRNLDALHDELSSEMVPTRIHIQYPAKPQGQMETYLPRLLRVFRDSAAENYHLEFTYEEIA